MKALTSTIALALALALSSPALAASEKSKGAGGPKAAAADTYKAPAQKSKKAMKGMTSERRAGVVSDVPRNRPECKKVGGSWDDQTNTCNEKKKM
jgi:hypothetical protein